MLDKLQRLWYIDIPSRNGTVKLRFLLIMDKKKVKNLVDIVLVSVV